MTTTILQAAVGAGKTEAALSRLPHFLQHSDKLFPKAWILLATRRQEFAFRQRLMDDTPDRAISFNVEFFNFYDLNQRLLNLAGRPSRRIDESVRRGMLGHVLDDLLQAGELAVFHRIAQTPGFIDLIADFIYELKQNQVYPDVFRSAAQRPGAFRKDHDIARIYSRYQDLLQVYDLVDREGEGWLALLALQEQPGLVGDVDLLLVDGYDQFTPVQAALLATLSGPIRHVIVTLTHLPDQERQETIGRRFKRAHEALQQAHEQAGQVLRTATIETHPGRSVVLDDLGRRIFRSEAEPITTDDTGTKPIMFIEAPDPAREVAAVLREIRRLLKRGHAPDEMLIALRDHERYQKHFVTWSRIYGVPLMLHYGGSITANPAVATLMKICALSEGSELGRGYRRTDLLDVLRSPYIQFPDLEDSGDDKDRLIDLLDQVSRDVPVLSGRDNWLNAVKQASEALFYEEDADETPLLTEKQSASLYDILNTFFNCVQLPEQGTVQDYVAWLETLIGPEPDDPDHLEADRTINVLQNASLNIIISIREMSDPAGQDQMVSRDIEAISSFKDVLRGFIQTEELLQRMQGYTPRLYTAQGFLRELRKAVSHTSVPQRDPGRSGRVLVTLAASARGLPHDHVFIPGLSEGIFPVAQSDDPLYLNSERQNLNQRGVRVRLPEERIDDDGLFYELISLPRKTLTLSRPTVQKGKEWGASHLWRRTRDVLHRGTYRTKTLAAGQLPALRDTVTVNEALLKVVDAAVNGASVTDDMAAIRALYRWLLRVHPAVWWRVRDGYGVESGRLSPDHPIDSYSGLIRNPELLEAIQSRLNDRYVWSATRLNAFGDCGYRFFAQYLLHLRGIEEPDEYLNVLQLGNIYHSILEQTYTVIRDEDMQIAPPQQADALDILTETADRLLEEAADKGDIQDTAIWRQERELIKTRLHALVELDFSSDSPLNAFGSPRIPWKLELKFGLSDGVRAVDMPISPDTSDTIRVRGAIDRIDRVGNDLIVIDYKSGTTGISVNKMETGRNVQMMVYLLALDSMLRRDGERRLRVGYGAFWHIRNLALSGKMTLPEDGVLADEKIQSAQEHVERYVTQARQGNYAVQPTELIDGRCNTYCEFYQLCRIASTSLNKPVDGEPQYD